jgi:signal transduction histidine kinase
MSYFLATIILALLGAALGIYTLILRVKFKNSQESLEKALEQIKDFREGDIEIEAIMQAVQDGVIITTADDRIRMASLKAASILRTEVKVLVGQNISTFLPVKDFKDKFNVDTTKDITLASGDMVTIQIKSLPIISGQKLNGVVFTIHDKTAEKAFEEMKFDFVAMVAHQLRTPMTSLKGYMYLLSESISGSLKGEDKTFLERSISGITKLSSLIEYLINVTNIGQNKLHINMQPGSMDKILVDVKDNYESIAAKHGIKLILEKPQMPMPLILMDSHLIETVLDNLVNNAIEHSQTKEIIIAAKKYDTEIWVSVQDFGRGIPGNALDHLFTKYYKVPTHLLATNGSGLGLYLSKQIIDAHYGKIWVDSLVGKGSTFSFSLPFNKKAG